MIVDAHQHFWNYDPLVHDWIDASIAGLRRSFLPDHLGHYLAATGVDRTVLVQASERLAENDFMQTMADQAEWVGAIVAWVDLASPDAVAQLERLAQMPLVKGVRPVLQGIEETDWILRSTVLDALSRLPGLGLRFDALIVPRHLDTMARLIDRLPDLAIVVDHAAKPLIAAHARPDDHWKQGMSRLACHPNVHCKLSGIAFEQGQGWTREGLQPVADHLLHTFGAQRLMWGSDWPVLEHVGSYIQWFDCVRELICGCDDVDQQAILGDTAARFYDIRAV